VATVAGLAGGPLVAGLLAEYAPWPTVLPYAVSLAFVLAALAGVLASPETVNVSGPLHLRPRRISIPANIAHPFLIATFVEMTAYAVAGTFAGLGGSFTRDLLHLESHAAAGLLVALLFVSSTAAQLALRRLSIRRSMRAGLGAIAAGLLLVLAALFTSSAPLFFAATVALGFGHGLAYVGSQELIDRIAPPARRAEVFSGFQLGLYVGATAPALLVGFCAAAIGFRAATVSFLGAVLVLALIGIAWLRHARSRTRLKGSVMSNSNGSPQVRHPRSIAEDAVILFADLQKGIGDLPLTVPEAQLHAGVGALARLAKIFEIPVVISTVPGNDGSPASVFPEIFATLGELPVLQRTTPNSFDSDVVYGAIAATKRKTLIVSGVATEVAVLLPCLSGVAEGYDVHVVLDCCGGVSPRSEDAALRRMAHAGVKTTSLPTLIGELAGDFAEPRGQAAIGVLFELAAGH
jgi:MFS family permease